MAAEKPKRNRRGSTGKVARLKADQGVLDALQSFDWYLKGVPIAEIAEKVGRHRDTVSRHLKRAREHWSKQLASSYETHVADQLARLDRIERAAWEGWERSLKDFLESSDEKMEAGQRVITKEKTSRRQRDGNATYLAVVERTVRQRSELLNLLSQESRDLATGMTVGDDPMVMPVVIESREEADEMRTLTLSELKKSLQPNKATAGVN